MVKGGGPVSLISYDDLSKGACAVKRLLIITLSAVLFSNLALAEAAQNSADEKAVTQLVHEWLDALVKGDLDALDRIVADDYIITNSDGSVLGKQNLDPLIKFESATVEDLKVRLYGETAVVTGTAAFKGSFNGRPFNSRERFTDVWLKRGGKWQVVASQQSTLPKQASSRLPKIEREKTPDGFQVAAAVTEIARPSCLS